MNGPGLKATNEPGGRERDDGTAQVRVDRDEIRRAFAAALAFTAPAEAPRPAHWDGGDASMPTRWRRTDVSMTEFAESVDGAAPGLAPAKADEKAISLVSRLSTAVTTAELGKVAFTVDRSNSGLSIVVEVENEAALRAVEADKRALFGALRTAGLTVLSFRILNRGGAGGGAGTGLALRGTVSDAKTPHFTRLGSRQLSLSGEGGDDDDDAGDRVRVVG